MPKIRFGMAALTADVDLHSLECWTLELRSSPPSAAPIGAAHCAERWRLGGELGPLRRFLNRGCNGLGLRLSKAGLTQSLRYSRPIDRHSAPSEPRQMIATRSPGRETMAWTGSVGRAAALYKGEQLGQRRSIAFPGEKAAQRAVGLLRRLLEKEMAAVDAVAGDDLGCVRARRRARRSRRPASCAGPKGQGAAS
jgi:hypothetical protein